MKSFRVVMLTLSLVCGSSLTAVAPAGDHCAHCGCCANLCKICRCVPAEKEVTRVCWDVKCEDFCVPGPSKCCGKVNECDECGQWCRTVWSPGCAEVYTKHIPVKKEVKRKVPSYKWVVETVCPACKQQCLANQPKLSTGQQLAASLELRRHEAAETKSASLGERTARLTSWFTRTK